jgi:hypothetical protein
MRIFLFLLYLTLPCYSLCVIAEETSREVTITLKNRTFKQVIPYLQPHLAKDGRLSGFEEKLVIKSTESNIKELLIIIGDLDRSDYMQLMISITSNVQAVHNINTRSIQVGANTWTKINYGISYSKRVRETLDNGKLVEKIKSVKVIESFQIFTQVDSENKILNLKLRHNQEDDDLGEYTDLSLNKVEINTLTDDNLQINLKGNLNEWIYLGNAINALHDRQKNNLKAIIERQKLTGTMAIKIQLLQ